MTEYAQLFQNRVKQTTATTGTGAVTWNAAVAQFFTFSFGIGVGTPCYYAGASGDGINFEVGIGTPTANGMTRDVCLSSTNANNFINLVGVSTFWVDIPASLVNALINMQPGTLLGRGATSIGDVQQLTIGTNLSIVGTTLNATGGGSGGVSVAGTPLVNQLTGWNNAATVTALSIGNNLSLVAGTLAAIDATGISVSGAPLANQIAGWNNAATVAALSIGNNLSLVAGTLAAIDAPSAVSIAGSPTSIFLTGWQNQTTITSVAVGANLSLASGTLSASSNSGISVTGSPAAGLIAGWASASSLLGVSIGPNISLVGGNTISAASSGGGISVVPTPTSGQLTAWSNAASVLGVTIGANISLVGGNTISASSGASAVSIAGSPTSLFITGWQNATTITSIAIGNNLSLASGTISAPGASSSAVSIAGSPTSLFITGWQNATTITSITVGSGLTLSASSITALGPVLFARSVAAASQANVSFSNIPTNGSAIEIRFWGRCNLAGASEHLFMQFNNDTGNNYDYAGFQANSNGQTGGDGLHNTSVTMAGFLPGTSTTGTSLSASGWVRLNQYANTAFTKTGTGQVTVPSGPAASLSQLVMETFACGWKSIGAINAVKLFPATSVFVANSSFELWVWS